MKNKKICVYLFTRSRFKTPEEELNALPTRFNRLRAEVRQGNKRVFATFKDVPISATSFSLIFNSNGTLREDVDPRQLDYMTKVKYIQLPMAYASAKNVVQRLIDENRFESVTSKEYSDMVNEEFNRMGGNDPELFRKAQMKLNAQGKFIGKLPSGNKWI